jgi:hypothetical protein
MKKPRWFNPAGNDARLVERRSKKPNLIPALTIVASNGSSQLKIRRHTTDKRFWHVRWRIFYKNGARLEGEFYWTSHDICAAFGENDMGIFWHVPGSRFARVGNYLNVPCPGTGHDGDPNISILLNPTIRAAVKKLIQTDIETA